MSTTPLSGAINILTLLNGVAPIGIILVESLLTRLQGKTDEEILTEADSHWADVIATARKELGQ